MENFATEKLDGLIADLNEAKWRQGEILDRKVGPVRQMVKDEINGIEKATKIVSKALKKLRDM
ncbi:MAG: hypothetical protein R3243_14800 [Arenibacter latericius]|nr:hypothetical protein [Arenibacter latericius]